MGHEVYDTTVIAGKALIDENFNMENDFEGSGSDIIFYHIPLNGNLNELRVTANIHYQSTPPKWMKEMFEESSPEIDTFRTMFANTDRTPVLMQSEETFVDGVNSDFEVKNQNLFKVFPSISEDGIFQIESDKIHDLFVIDLNGKIVHQEFKRSANYAIQLNDLKGVFFLNFRSEKGLIFTQKVILE
jgi:hypothetical protein